ncbi:TPA: hypothetical protein ACGO1T_001590 [Streptococcus suis]
MERIKNNFYINADNVLLNILNDDDLNYYVKFLDNHKFDATMKELYFEVRRLARARTSLPVIIEVVNRIKDEESIEDSLMDRMCCEFVFNYAKERLIREITLMKLEKESLIQEVYQWLINHPFGKENSVNV